MPSIAQANADLASARAQAIALKAQLITLQASPASAATIAARVDAALDAVAATRNELPNFIAEVSRGQPFSSDQAAFLLGEASPVALILQYDRPALKTGLLASANASAAAAKAALGSSSDYDSATIANVKAQLLAAEILEEQSFRILKGNGFAITRRVDISPAVVQAKDEHLANGTGRPGV